VWALAGDHRTPARSFATRRTSRCESESPPGRRGRSISKRAMHPSISTSRDLHRQPDEPLPGKDAGGLPNDTLPGRPAAVSVVTAAFRGPDSRKPGVTDDGFTRSRDRPRTGQPGFRRSE
jgi:hypothetical protein